MATVTVHCRYCESELVYKHGHARSGEAHYRCRDCLRCFQLDYRYEGNEQGVPERIIAMALNGSGVRDTSRVLGVSITTVIAHLKKLRPAAVNPLPTPTLLDQHGTRGGHGVTVPMAGRPISTIFLRIST